MGSKRKRKGFVVAKGFEGIHVAFPTIRKTRVIQSVDLRNYEDVKFSLQDIDGIIDFALDTHDEDWFDKLVEMKSLLQRKLNI